jgi:hypothetical protein
MRKIDINIYNSLIFNGVLSTPILDDKDIQNWGINSQEVCAHYDSYLNNFQLPNMSGPIEKHPYIDLYQSDCDFERETLILGTFPPSSYLNNLELHNLPNPNIQPNNPTHFFYGNMNDLWYYLFGMDALEVTIPSIQASLLKKSISITDVFSYVMRKNMISAFDSEYRNIVLNSNICRVFNSESKIKNILFTSGSLSSFLGNTTSTLTGFRWILEDCCNGLHNFSISGDATGNGQFYPINALGIQNAIQQQNNGIVWWLNSGEKKVRIVNLPSPAPMAAQKMIGSTFFKRWINYKAITNGLPAYDNETRVREYVNNFPDVFDESITKQFRREVYQMVLNNEILDI